jgi:hypothetical protein
LCPIKQTFHLTNGNNFRNPVIATIKASVFSPNCSPLNSSFCTTISKTVSITDFLSVITTNIFSFWASLRFPFYSTKFATYEFSFCPFFFVAINPTNCSSNNEPNRTIFSVTILLSIVESFITT